MVIILIAGDSDVRLQWDPDHKPDGSKETRRAIQLGLRNSVRHYKIILIHSSDIVHVLYIDIVQIWQ